MKPLADDGDRLELVWCGVAPGGGVPDPLSGLLGRPDVRALAVAPASHPRPPAGPVPVPGDRVGATEGRHAWRLELPSPSPGSRAPRWSGRRARSAILGAVWELGFRRPVWCAAPGAAPPPWVVRAGWPVLEAVPGVGDDELYGRLRAAAARPPTRPLRVLALDHCAARSGAEVALARLLPAVPGVSAQAVLAEDGPLVGMLGDAGVPVEVVPLEGRTRSLSRGSVVPGAGLAGAAADSLAYAWRLARTARRHRADLVVTNTLKAALYGGLAGHLAGVPVVWHLRDRVADDYLPAPAVRLVRAAARVLPAGIVANSDATLASLRLPPAARRRLRAVAVGDPCPFPVLPWPAGRGDLPAIGMVGRLAPWKGQDVFLRAVARAFPDPGARPPVRIVGAALFGEEDYAGGLVDLADRLGLGDSVTFTGHVDDVEAELARLEVVVHASVIPEPFGQTVVEAMAAGRAVVAAGAGGPAEIVTDGVDGLLHPPGDEEALAGCLAVLAGSPDLRHRLGRAAAASAARFAPARVGAEVAAAYRLASAGAGGGRRRRWPGRSG